MKKLLIASNVLFLSIIIYQGCAPARSVVAAATCPPCKSYNSVPFAGLTTSTAHIISNDYKALNQNHQLAMSNTLTVEDANSIWFSLETLKTFIWNIEDAACKKGCYNSGVNNLNLGVRIYYGRYPDNDTMNNTNDLTVLPNGITGTPLYSFARHHTIFMVPTFQDNSNPDIQWDFDPWHWSSNTTVANCTPTAMAQWLVDTIAPFGNNRSLILSQTANYPQTPNPTQNAAANHGDMIPPGKSTPSPGPGF